MRRTTQKLSDNDLNRIGNAIVQSIASLTREEKIGHLIKWAKEVGEKVGVRIDI